MQNITKDGLAPEIKNKSKYEVILSVYFIYIVFEWTIWGVMPLSYQKVSLIRSAMDVMFFAYFTFVGCFGKNKIKQAGRWMLGSLTLVVFSVGISSLIHKVNPYYALQSVLVVFRFVPILLMPEFYGKTFNRVIWVVFFVQIMIGIVEGAGIFDLRKILLPAVGKWGNLENFSPTSFRDGLVGISTTFLNTIDFALYLIASYVILYWRKSRRFKTLIACTVLFLIVRTESKTSMLMFACLLFFEINSYLLRLVAASIFASGAVFFLVKYKPLVIFFLENSLEYSRIGFFVYLLPPFLCGNLMEFLFGIGVDPFAGIETIKNYPRLPLMLVNENNLLNLKDVFWVAQLLQWGFIGFVSLMTFLLYLYRKRESQTVHAMLWVVFVLGFTNQIMEIKIFSFLLWIAISRYRQLI